MHLYLYLYLQYCYHRLYYTARRAKLSGAVYCNRSCLCVCLFACLWVCYHDNSKLCASKLHQTGSGFLGKCSDHLQLVKFWPSCAPEGVLRRGDIFLASPLPARNVCVSLSVFLSQLQYEFVFRRANPSSNHPSLNICYRHCSCRSAIRIAGLVHCLALV